MSVQLGENSNSVVCSGEAQEGISPLSGGSRLTRNAQLCPWLCQSVGNRLRRRTHGAAVRVPGEVKAKGCWGTRDSLMWVTLLSSV